MKFEEKEEEWSDDNDDKFKIHKPKSDMEKRRKLVFYKQNPREVQE